MIHSGRVRSTLRCGVAAAVVCLAAPAALAQPPAAAPAPGPAAPFPTGPGSLAGMWSNAAYKPSDKFPESERILETTDGKWPPLLPAAKALLEQRIQDSINGHPYANTLSECLPGGVPQMLFGAGYPIQILETPGQVTMLTDEQNHFRIIPLGGPHAQDPDPSYFGDSIAHWEGGTLVVDTIGLTERTSLDQIGMPHSEDLHVIERFKRTSATTMEIEVTIDDPKTFSQPWQTKAFYRIARPGTKMDEYICENNRNMPDASGRQGFSPPPGH